VKKIVYKNCLVMMKKLKKKKEDSGLEVVNILVVKLKILLIQLQLLLPLLMLLLVLLLVTMKKPVTMKKLVTMKKKKKNFTDSSQKLKETGLTICLK